MLRTILLLQWVLSPCAASPWIHPASPLSLHGVTKGSPSWHARRRRVAFMVPRGGASADDSDSSDLLDCEEDDYGVDEDADATYEVESDEGEPSEPVLDRLSLLTSSSRSLSSAMVHYAAVLMRVTKRACVAGARAIASGRESDKEDEVDGECSKRPVVHTMLGRTVYVLGEMYHAATTPGEGSEVGDDARAEEVRGHHKRRKRRKRSHAEKRHGRRRRKHRHVTSPTEIVCNGGGMDPSNNHAILQLAKQYDIDLPTDEAGRLSKRYDAILPSAHTPLNEALQRANADARFLVCYISRGNGGRGDSVAIPNLLSSDFVKAANRRPLGKKQTGDTSSYYVWVCTDDKEAEVATKRLKVKPPASRSKGKGAKKKGGMGAAPIMAIVYPASTVDPSSGRLKVTPRILAQHHCHPPPSSPETLIAWANTIRKRHLREYAKLQHDRKELQLLKERTEGYASSMKEDREREKKEELEAQKRKEEEEKERQRQEEIEERRKELLEALPDEPEAGTEGAITIALRFADGRRDQRRFLAEETSMNDVLNWIDATHNTERERVELSTMNGAKQFRYMEDVDEDVTLAEAGLGRMTALRVSEIEDDEEEVEGEESEDEEGEDEESEVY